MVLAPDSGCARDAGVLSFELGTSPVPIFPGPMLSRGALMRLTVGVPAADTDVGFGMPDVRGIGSRDRRGILVTGSWAASRELSIGAKGAPVT